MKIIVCISLICSCALWAGPICDQKKDQLYKKLEQAKQTNHISKIQNLQKAITSTEAFCEDAVVIADTRKKITQLENAILAKEGENVEYQTTGRFAKIEENKEKIIELQKELEEERADLKLYESL